jgi:hypothetical protein
MFDRLRILFRGTKPARGSPSGPLEILVPDGASPGGPPKFAGKLLSHLVASPQDTTMIEIDPALGQCFSRDSDLLLFLTAVDGSGQLDTLVSQCRAILYPPDNDRSIGYLGCLQQSQFYSFRVCELSPSPALKWEIHRATQQIKA